MTPQEIAALDNLELDKRCNEMRSPRLDYLHPSTDANAALALLDELTANGSGVFFDLSGGRSVIHLTKEDGGAYEFLNKARVNKLAPIKQSFPRAIAELYLQVMQGKEQSA